MFGSIGNLLGGAIKNINPETLLDLALSQLPDDVDGKKIINDGLQVVKAGRDKNGLMDYLEDLLPTLPGIRPDAKEILKNKAEWNALRGVSESELPQHAMKMAVHHKIIK
jgi:hypothetical protein